MSTDTTEGGGDGVLGRKKGTVKFDETAPDDFDPSNVRGPPVAMLEMREHVVREKWIDIEKVKILGEKLKWCHLVQQYLDSTRGIGWGKDGRHHSFLVQSWSRLNDSLSFLD